MSLPKILVINGSVWASKGAEIKALLASEGHELVATTEHNVTTFIHTLETAFPTVYADIKTGIAAAKDDTLSGGEKAVKIATAVLATAPDAIKDLAGAKDVLVAAVTTLFAAEVSAFKDVTTETIEGLSTAVTTGIAGTDAAVAPPATA